MREVVRLLNAGHQHEALVRLWVIATRRKEPDDDLPLNSWERTTRRTRRSALSEKLGAALDDGRDVEPAIVDTEPLALVVALDTFLGLHTPPKGFAAEPYRVDDRAYWLVPLNLGRALAAGIARQAGNSQSWFRHHRVVPAVLPSGVHVEAQPSRDVTDARLREVRRTGHVRAYLGHFEDGATLEPPPAGRFFATGLSDEPARIRNIDRSFARAADERADLVIFPELTVTPAQREATKERLRTSEHPPALLVPGSFHEEWNGRKVNTSHILGVDGRTLVVHEKLRSFGEADGTAEDIHAANTVHVLVTPIGCIALAICKDYCDDPGPIRDWDALAVDWWLVPSMGAQSTIDAHERRARSLWTVINRAVTLLANQEPAIPPRSVASPGFAFHGTTREVRSDVTVGGGLVVVAIDAPGPDRESIRRVR